MIRALLLAAALVAGGVAEVGAQAARPAPAKSAKTAPSPVLPGGNSRDPIAIDAKKLEWFDKDQKAVYTGDVVVVQGDSSLKAQVLTIFLTRDDKAQPAAAGAPPAQGSSQIRRMEANGGVTVIQKDQVGTGDNGVYDKTENKVYLLGNVALSQGPNVTTGDKLVYDLDARTAVVEGQRVKGLFMPGSGGEKPAPGGQKPKKIH